MSYSHILGVDEAGRGPLAGPVAIGVVKVTHHFDIRRAFLGVNDSKQISEALRETIYREMLGRRKAGEIDFCVRLVGAKTIDEIGITRAVRRGVWSGVRALSPDAAEVFIKLDGLLHAPVEYAQEPVISLASIAAKVTRDALMKRMAREYPQYAFELHKGYGTRKHYEAIEQWGPSAIHRRSFLGLTTKE